MDIVSGSALILLALYTSTLAYSLRTFSRSRLGELLPDATREVWFGRLDRYESELQVVASAVRLTSIVGLMMFFYARAPEWWADQALLSDFWFASLLNLACLIVFAVGIPHSLSIHAPEWVLVRSLPALWALRFVLMPVEKGLSGIDFVVRRLVGIAGDGSAEEAERHEQEILDAVSEGELYGAVDEDQKEMIESVLEMRETPVEAIMTPRTDIVALPVTATPQQVRQTIVDAGHSRIPVYDGSLDHIIGVLYAKDLINVRDSELDLPKLMRSVPYTPESKTIDRLLRELRTQRVHIAIVLDEFGGTAGLVTIEDIIEELVGEIDDEYDRPAVPELKQIDADTVEVDARVPVSDVNEALAVEIPEDGDYETIGGFVFSALGKIPAAGEGLNHNNVHIRVLDAEPRKINRLRISVAREPKAQPA